MASKPNYAKIALELVAGITTDQAYEILLHVIRERPSAVVSAVENIATAHPLKDKLHTIRINTTAQSSVERAIIRFSKDNGRIPCIKRYRELTQAGLKEAKEAVDEIHIKYNLKFGDGNGMCCSRN